MKKNLFSLILFLSPQALSQENLLFENNDFQLYDNIGYSCNHLFLYDKKTKVNIILKDPIDGDVNLAEKNCYTTKDKESIKVTFFPSDVEDFSNNKFLRVNYDLDYNILISPNEYQKIPYSKCAIIDMDNAVFIGNENAREEVCSEADFVKYIFPNLGFPITWENLLIYVKNNKFTDLIEYEINNYISILLSIDYDFEKINNVMEILNNTGYTAQSERILSYNYVKIKEKSYLYSDDLMKSNMYLIKGDKVKILKDKLDDKGIKWYLINYKGKKEINMWIKADSVDLN